MFQNFSESEQEQESYSVEQERSRSLKNVTPLISAKKAGAVFLDLTTAYNIVWHRGLICKLRDRYMVRMIMELVDSRSFTLTAGNNKRSRLRSLKIGVQQGSSWHPFFSASKPLTYQSSSLEFVSNYQPISILLQFNKIFERILYDRVHFYLQEYKLLSKYQFGLRPGSSTSWAVESIYSSFE